MVYNFHYTLSLTVTSYLPKTENRKKIFKTALNNALSKRNIFAENYWFFATKCSDTSQIKVVVILKGETKISGF